MPCILKTGRVRPKPFLYAPAVSNVVTNGNGTGTNWRTKRARHYQACTNSSWCGIYIFIT